MLRLLPLVVVVLLQFACSSIDCPVDNIVEVNYVVKAFDGNNEVADTLKDTLNIWSRRFDGTDTLLYNSGTGVKSFSLPMSYTEPEDVLVFKVTDTLHVTQTDTVWVSKENIAHFESVDCPTRYFHQLTAVRSTHVRIDTIIINNPSVTYDSSVKHLHIHFKD
jgi:hypothetical protein